MPCSNSGGISASLRLIVGYPRSFPRPEPLMTRAVKRIGLYQLCEEKVSSIQILINDLLVACQLRVVDERLHAAGFFHQISTDIDDKPKIRHWLYPRRAGSTYHHARSACSAASPYLTGDRRSHRVRAAGSPRSCPPL